MSILRVQRFKCCNCGRLYIEEDKAMACSCPSASQVAEAVAAGVPLLTIEDTLDARENQPRPLTEQGMPEKYPDPEPQVDPFDCLDEHISMMAAVIDGAPTQAVWVTVYEARKLITGLREERRVMLALCQKVKQASDSGSGSFSVASGDPVDAVIQAMDGGTP